MNQDIQTAASGEVIVMLNLHFKPGSAQKVLEKMLPAIRLTRMEPGNNEFQMFKVKGSEDKYVVFERWKDHAALKWHWEQPYTKEALELFSQHLATPLSETEDVAYLADVMERAESSRVTGNTEHSRFGLRAPDGKAAKLPYCRRSGYRRTEPVAARKS